LEFTGGHPVFVGDGRDDATGPNAIALDSGFDHLDASSSFEFVQDGGISFGC
jgi:hypothetical protein